MHSSGSENPEELRQHCAIVDKWEQPFCCGHGFHAEIRKGGRELSWRAPEGQRVGLAGMRRNVEMAKMKGPRICSVDSTTHPESTTHPMGLQLEKACMLR